MRRLLSPKPVHAAGYGRPQSLKESRTTHEATRRRAVPRHLLAGVPGRPRSDHRCACAKQSWVVRTPIGGLVIGRQQVQALLADRRLHSSLPAIVRMQGVTEGPLYEARLDHRSWRSTATTHVRLRKLVSRAFTPRAVDVHRADMRTTLLRLVEPFASAGRCDFMAAVAEHYPIEVMCHLLGVPDERPRGLRRRGTARSPGRCRSNSARTSTKSSGA